MKNSTPFRLRQFACRALAFLFFFIVISISACDTNVDGARSSGRLQFSFSGTDIQSSGRIEATDFDHIIVTIKNEQGDAIHLHKALWLLDFGTGTIVSESLELPPGEWLLTEFLVLNGVNEVMYAAPYEGSEQAVFVNDALPIEFFIDANESKTLNPEIVKVVDQSPADFGYVDFGPLNIVEGKIQFELFSTAGYVSDNHKITFKAVVNREGYPKWDTTLPPMLIKDIPGINNKIVFQKQFESAKGSVGFDYYIEGVGYSWYYEELVPGENKLFSFDFH